MIFFAACMSKDEWADNGCQNRPVYSPQPELFQSTRLFAQMSVETAVVAKMGQGITEAAD
jgi:hypothetical protein